MAEDWISQSAFLATCVLVWLVALRETGLRLRWFAHPLAIFTAALMYMTTGPWIAYVMGQIPPSGYPLEIGMAGPTYAHALVVLGFAAGYMIIKRRSDLFAHPKPCGLATLIDLRFLPGAYRTLILLSVAGLCALMSPYILNPGLLHESKGVVMKAVAASPLLLGLTSSGTVCLVVSWCLIAAMRDAQGLRPLSLKLAILLGVYVFCSVIASEREVLFVLVAVGLAWLKGHPIRVTEAAVGLGIVGAMFIVPPLLRPSTPDPDGPSGAALAAYGALTTTNSVLVMTAWAVAMVPDPEPYRYGATYGASLAHMMPSAIYRADGLETGIDWFRNHVASSQSAGWNLSLPCEAYVNGGYWGIVIFFGLAGGVAAALYRTNSGWRRFQPLYGFFLASLLASMNSDTVTLFKVVGYGAFLWALIYRPVVRRSSPAA